MSSILRNSTAALLVALLFAYSVIICPFTAYMKHKPIEEKLGYLPSIDVLRYASADHKELMGASLVMKVVMYYGGIIEKNLSNVIVQPPDYQRMSGILHGAVKLDPYNMDAYYMAQSFLTWEVKQYKLANDLLDYGMKYRTWDWMLPLFAGFNCAYFMKDFNNASEYYKRAGELSGNPLYFSLAGRYMQESGQTDLAIAYLTAIVKGERNQAVKNNYQIRLAAFKEVRRIERARDRFKVAKGVLPTAVEQLMQSGFLAPPPVDPYGGTFYLEPDGKVATTSKFAFAGVKNEKRQNTGESHERH
jgi:tetratricopeptide (TPR) repeat protein